jgi:hypothetical protein
MKRGPGRQMPPLPKQFPEWFRMLPGDASLSAAELARVFNVTEEAIRQRGLDNTQGFPKQDHPKGFSDRTYARWRVRDIRAWIKSQREKETA